MQQQTATVPASRAQESYRCGNYIVGDCSACYHATNKVRKPERQARHVFEPPHKSILFAAGAHIFSGTFRYQQSTNTRSTVHRASANSLQDKKFTKASLNSVIESLCAEESCSQLRITRAGQFPKERAVIIRTLETVSLAR